MNPPIEVPVQPHDPDEEPNLPPWHACGGLRGKYDASPIPTKQDQPRRKMSHVEQVKLVLRTINSIRQRKKSAPD